MKQYIALILVLVAAYADAHGFVSEPISRTSIFLRPEFNTQQPFWWDHLGVWCGNVPQNTAYSTCGRCGEAPGGREASQGGIYDKGVIVATYTAGSIINVTVVYGDAHYGGFQLELCPQVTETDTCFQVLTMVESTQRIMNGNRLCTPYDYQHNNIPVSVRVQLPPNVRCDRCTLRWTHRTFYPWSPEWAQDNCFTPNPTQTFRNCVDIRIQ